MFLFHFHIAFSIFTLHLTFSLFSQNSPSQFSGGGRKNDNDSTLQSTLCTPKTKQLCVRLSCVHCTFGLVSQPCKFDAFNLTAEIKVKPNSYRYLLCQSKRPPNGNWQLIVADLLQEVPLHKPRLKHDEDLKLKLFCHYWLSHLITSKVLHSRRTVLKLWQDWATWRQNIPGNDHCPVRCSFEILAWNDDRKLPIFLSHFRFRPYC